MSERVSSPKFGDPPPPLKVVVDPRRVATHSLRNPLIITSLFLHQKWNHVKAVLNRKYIQQISLHNFYGTEIWTRVVRTVCLNILVSERRALSATFDIDHSATSQTSIFSWCGNESGRLNDAIISCSINFTIFCLLRETEPRDCR
jgi:hypothetical protein